MTWAGAVSTGTVGTGAMGELAVPAAEAQSVCDQLVLAGVKGLLNFAPVRLRVPVGLHVENVDLMMALDRVAYYAHERP